MWQAGLFLDIFGGLLVLAGLWTRAGHDGLIWRDYLKPKGKHKKEQLRTIGNWVTIIGVGIILLGFLLITVFDD